MKVDFRFTEEGDLEVGSPKVDKFGKTLYVNSAGEETSEPTEGEMIRDIPLQVSFMSDKQVARNRLKTDNPDWLLHPEIGADLSELIGMSNTRATGDVGRQLIEKCLTADGFINSDDLTVRPVPISSKEILFHITLKRKAGDVVMPYLFNLEHGLLTEYEVKES